MMIIYGGYVMEWDTEYLIPGMIVKNDLLPEGALEGTAPLLPAGKTITVEDIVRLNRHKIDKIEIEEYNETFFELFRKFATSNIKKYNPVSITRVARLYEYIVNRTRDFSFDMTRYLDEDIDLQNHDVNVASMAVALAAKHNNTVTADEQISIKDMAEVALFRNIGRRAKNKSLLEQIKNKYGSMLDKFQDIYPNLPDDIFEYYHREHDQFYSYLILKGAGMNNTQLTSILLHHEREVGKNGPLGVDMSKLDSKLQSVKMAKIMKVCELYDILLYRSKNDHPEQPFGSVNKELDKMVASGLTDPYWTKMLSMIVPVYPLGERVELSDGTIGVVSGYNEYDMSKPYVKDLNGNDVDLYKEQLVVIGLVGNFEKATPAMSMSAGA